MRVRGARVKDLHGTIRTRMTVLAGVLCLVALVAVAPTASALDARYHTRADVHDEILALQSAYPSIVSVDTLGVSSEEGLDIWGVKLSDNVDVDEDEPVVLYNGVHHAEEVMGLEVIMWMLDELTAAYGVNDTVTSWIDGAEIWFIPMLNPEGHSVVVAGTDTTWRKNKRDNNGNGIFDLNYDGVDFNFNYDFNWSEGGSDLPASEYYRGPEPFSESETRLIRDFCLTHKPVFSLNYHSPRSSDGDLVYYPWYWPLEGFAPDHYAIYDIVTELCDRTLTEEDEPYSSYYGYADAGKCRNWQYGVVGTFGYTMEILSYLCQPGGDRVDAICERVANGSYYLLERLGGPGITGHVTDASTGLPLVAEVEVLEIGSDLIEARTTEPAHGRYWKMVTPGTYSLEFSCDGYETETVGEVVVDTTGLTVVDVEMSPSGSDDETGGPRVLRVAPNPFRGSIVVSFVAPGATLASIEIYTASGRLVATCPAEIASNEEGTAVWDGLRLSGGPAASGVYFARLVTDVGEDEAKMVYIR
mgnify:CR=1 FL=1